MKAIQIAWAVIATSAGVVGTSPFAIAASSILEQAKSYRWTAGEADGLHSLFTNSQAVAGFVNEVEQNDGVLANVGEFSFMDLSGDGSLELICTVDYSGRGFFTELLVFSMQRGKAVKTVQSTNGANIEDLSSRLIDLGHDGRHEILIPRLMDAYAGADPVATFTDVYTYQDGHLTQADRQFRDYYQNQRLPALKAQLKKLLDNRDLAGSADNAKAIDATRKELDAVNQLLSR